MCVMRVPAHAYILATLASVLLVESCPTTLFLVEPDLINA
jgi:hypothetical protein